MWIEQIKVHALMTETGCLDVATEFLLGRLLFPALETECRGDSAIKSFVDDLILNSTVVTLKIGNVYGACLYQMTLSE